MVTVNDFLETDLGNVSPNPCGDYDGAAVYEYLDQVHYAGGSYLCVVPIEQTVTGVAPMEGKTTAQWQCVAIPGNIRPDYIAMHDQVAKDAEQVAGDREAVAADRDEVAIARADVEQMRLDTSAYAREAEASRDSAAGYNRTAHTAMEAAEQARQDVQALVTGFDGRVEAETQEAVATVETARQTAVSVINSTGETIIADARAAQRGAETARTGAETARTGAETARTGAETAKAGADTAKTAAKTSETNAGKSASAAKASETNAKASETAASQTQREVTDYVESQKAAFVGYSKRETDSQYANAIIKTATGAGRVDVEDAWTAPVIGLDVVGRSEQVQTTGAQLLDWDQVTFQNCKPIKEGEVRCNINNTTYALIDISFLKNYLLAHKGEKITVSCKGNPEGKNITILAYGTFEDGRDYKASGAKGCIIDFTIPDNVITYGRIEIRVNNNSISHTDTTTVISDIMLNAGSTPLPYEPYTGAAASPSPEYPQQIVSTGTVGTGAQLLDLRAGKGGTGDGVTYTRNNDGTYKQTGTASASTGNVWFLGGYGIAPTEDNSNVLLTLEAGKTYTIIECRLFSGSTSMHGTVTIDAATYPDGFRVTGVRNPWQATGTAYNVTIYPMVCEGQYAKPWEPYTGGRPAPSAEYPQELTVRATGANLFGGDALVEKLKAEAKATVDRANETVTYAGSAIAGRVLYSDFKPGKEYTIILYGKNLDNQSKHCNLQIKRMDESYAMLQFDTAGSNAYCIYHIADGKGISCLKGIHATNSTLLYYDKCGIFEGNITLDDFESYRAAAATITLTEPLHGKGEYRDRLGLRDGVWGIERYWKSMILDGVVTYDIFNQLGISKEIRLKNKNIKPVNGLFSNLRTVESSWGDDRVGIGSFSGASTMAGYKLITLRIPIDADPAEYMAEHPTEVVYQPFDYPLWTPLPDADQQALNALTTFAGTTHLTITTGGTTPDVTLDYVQDTHKALEQCQAAAKDYTDNQIADILALLPTATQAAIINNGASALLAESEV